MHSELSDVITNASTNPVAPESATVPSQHGLDSSDRLLPLRSGSAAGADIGAPDAVDDALFGVYARGELAADDDARLKKPSPPPRNRIAEYENALSPSPQRKPEGPIFEVIKKNRKAGDKSSPVAKLPNEILTHALSHLPPNDLSAVALVSRRFHSLVTTRHAWRVAFARYFPGPDSITIGADYVAVDGDEDNLRSDRRAFARLTALASWRSEYILRTRLLRSLGRGKPMALPTPSANSRSNANQTPQAIIMYNSQLFTTVNHLHATFGSGLNKRLPLFIHGANDIGMASASDPSAGKADGWGLSDPQLFLQFFERFPGEAQWGLGPGNLVGNPNVMDVSQPYGMVHGEGSPGGSIYHRSTEEMRGRFLSLPMELSSPELGIPKLLASTEAISSVWIAKSASIPTLSDGLIGMLCGSSSGVVSAYSLGTNGLQDSRLGRGELTARWVLSPGVPIVALAVDDAYSPKRLGQNRIWCIALNALGELFFLTKFPKRPPVPKSTRLDEPILERLAWATGRTVYWSIVEPSRRVARPDPYRERSVDGSYSPRSSWNGMCLTEEQIKAETQEINAFLRMKPIDFRTMCIGWDMRRKIEVDFAGDDGNNAGEAIVVFDCGLDEDSTASAKRFTRLKVPTQVESKPMPKEVSEIVNNTQSSLFGGSDVPSRPPSTTRPRQSSVLSSAVSPERPDLVEEWRCSMLSFNGAKSVEVATTTLDISTYATMTLSEDPIFGFSGSSTASSPYASPFSDQSQAATPADVPGQRARFVAAGTNSGSIFMWDMRAAVAKSTDLVNTIEPVRIIYTDSPQISCLAITGLYLVHGGNDGLVQAWDPLASSMQPIRTLNSRFSSRARRRLVQAQASPQGVGINLFAAGAICLDPDPTVLRGMVSLGTHLRYWSYSSSAADQYKSNKRRVRRSERGSNSGGAGPNFSASGRSKIMDFISAEKHEMERDAIQRQREADHLAGRFGVDLLDDEEQALAYATMLSQEALASETEKKKQSEASSVVSDTPTIPATLTPSVSSSPALNNDEDLDADLAEAIRLSLQESEGSFPTFDEVPAAPIDNGFDIPIKYAKGRKASPPASSSRQTSWAEPNEAGAAGSSNDKEMDDLEYAIQLSLAEERSRAEQFGEYENGNAEVAAEEFPALAPVPGAKGKRRAW
ncbi:hypothetical protein DIS24_g8197 [Lasiodiplodia hormozganensis]|uniref:F-box domain-containing protein n=1 Tax=Lasiodiplodia hormozganensis TaxID=869390 RepID=A0AA39Y4V1_9PEZI|nr:hypothetical protein DIS24_g8197 [Lasiodiplodia hormozganensis]